MATTVLTNDNFQTEVLDFSGTVLVDFWAEWCGPCRMLSPILDEVAAENPQIKIGKVNVDEQQELASKFGIMSIPTLLVYKKGSKVSESIGLIPKEQVENLIK